MKGTVLLEERVTARRSSPRLARIAGVLGILAVAALFLSGSDVARAQQPAPAPRPAPAPQSGALQQPRTLTVTLYMSAVDNELVFNDETGNSSQQRTLNFERWGESQNIIFDRLCVGDEVKVTAPMTAIADPTGGITIQGSAQLWEGDDCDTTDLADTETISFTVSPGGREQVKKELENEGIGGGDTGTVEITAVNGPFIRPVPLPRPAVR
jgi:hypothetical protein